MNITSIYNLINSTFEEIANSDSESIPKIALTTAVALGGLACLATILKTQCKRTVQQPRRILDDSPEIWPRENRHSRPSIDDSSDSENFDFEGKWTRTNLRRRLILDDANPPRILAEPEVPEEVLQERQKSLRIFLRENKDIRNKILTFLHYELAGRVLLSVEPKDRALSLFKTYVFQMKTTRRLDKTKIFLNPATNSLTCHRTKKHLPTVSGLDPLMFFSLIEEIGSHSIPDKELNQIFQLINKEEAEKLLSFFEKDTKGSGKWLCKSHCLQLLMDIDLFKDSDPKRWIKIFKSTPKLFETFIYSIEKIKNNKKLTKSIIECLSGKEISKIILEFTKEWSFSLCLISNLRSLLSEENFLELCNSLRGNFLFPQDNKDFDRLMRSFEVCTERDSNP